jgi:monofunctional glycosyltransferase
MNSFRIIKYLQFFIYFLISYALLAILFYTYLVVTAPNVGIWKKKNPGREIILSKNSNEYNSGKRRNSMKYQWVSIGQVPELMIKSITVAEDASFWVHNGIDWHEVEESFKKNLAEGGFLRGGSTITQQLAKNLYLSKRKSISRKLREWIIARKLEKELRKTRILELYLNVIEWGDNIYGIQAAAQFYFQKNVSALSLNEMARLAAVIPNPHRMRPDRVNYAVYWRTNIVLKRLRRFNYIDDDEFNLASAKLDSLYHKVS